MLANKNFLTWLVINIVFDMIIQAIDQQDNF